jgi:hypothetical protein
MTTTNLGTTASDQPRRYYLFFGDEAAGGFGYWLGDADQSNAAAGEKYIESLYSGSFPAAKEEAAISILEETCRRMTEKPLETNLFEILNRIGEL